MPSRNCPPGRYAGANYLCADGKYAAVVYGGPRVEAVELQPGLHTLSSGNLNDANDDRHAFIRRMLTLHTLDSAVTFLAVASRAFARKADSEGRRGVVLEGGSVRHGFVQRCSRCRGRSSSRFSSTATARLRTVPTRTFPRCCGRSFPPGATASRPSPGKRKDGEGHKSKSPKPVAGGG